MIFYLTSYVITTGSDIVKESLWCFLKGFAIKRNKIDLQNSKDSARNFYHIIVTSYSLTCLHKEKFKYINFKQKCFTIHSFIMMAKCHNDNLNEILPAVVLINLSNMNYYFVTWFMYYLCKKYLHIGTCEQRILD